ncbi:hypothetical protein [Dongia sp.]|uniref:hypothetical protein n=1 Tax=Dongia sp. TaxID=1977262 RepID=UPI0035AF4BFC
MLDNLKDTAIKVILVAYLVIAFFVGVERSRESGRHDGTVMTVIYGAGWPISLLIDAAQRK